MRAIVFFQWFLCLSVLSWAGHEATAKEGAEPVAAQAAVVFAGDLIAETIPQQMRGQHRLWVNDWGGAMYSRSVLYDSDKGDMLGSVETGWQGMKLNIPRTGDLIYNDAIYMSRGYHGERTDVVESFNRYTLELKGEIAIPPKPGRGIPTANHSTLTDDDQFILVDFFTPGSSVGVVELATKKYVGEIETAGCAYVYAAGPRQFFTLCGDGSVLLVVIDDNGAELSRQRYPGIFDAQGDPMHGTGVRAGDQWIFVTLLGQVHSIVIGDAELSHEVLFDAGQKSSGNRAWVPAEMYQNLAVHTDLNLLYLLVGEQSLEPKGGGTDFHRHPGTEIWVFELNSGNRVRKIELPDAMLAIAVSQDEAPLLYASTAFLPGLHVFSANTGELVRTIETGFAMNTILQPVEPR
jgi:methylamine dehydrogenase heavy chain